MQQKKRMSRWLKITLRFLAITTIIVMLFWLALALYVNYNKQSLLQKVSAQINNKLKGDLQIGAMDLTLFSRFPNISVTLQKVSLRDSLWEQHKHDLVKANYVHIDLELFSLLKGNPAIHQLQIDNGQFYLYTDSNNYSNTWALQPKVQKEKKKKGEPDIENISVRNVQFVIENTPKAKYFVIDIKNVSGKRSNTLSGWNARLNTDVFIQQFCFNRNRGSFLQNKTLKGIILLEYNEATKEMTIPKQGLTINKDAITLSGKFLFAEKPAAYTLNIAADNIMHRNATSLLTKVISSKADLVNLDKPLSVKAIIIGKFKYRDTPWVRTYWTVKDNNLHTPKGIIQNTSFTGYFNNQVVRGDTYGDENTAIYSYNMRGDWNGIQFLFDTASITNLKRPVLYAKVHTDFELAKMNKLTNGNTFDFKNGKAFIDLIYKGGLHEDDTTAPYIHGSIKIKQAAITYTPRNISFTNCNGEAFFNGSDLSVPNLQLTRNKSTLQMKGGVVNFLHLFYNAPGKALIDWHVTGALVDINDFTPFLSKAKIYQFHT